MILYAEKGSIPTARKKNKLMKSTTSIDAASTVTLPHGEVLTRFSKKNRIVMLLSNGVFQVLEGALEKVIKKESAFKNFSFCLAERTKKVI